MPVELRKRPAPKEDPAPAAKRSASKPRATTTSKAKQVVEKAKALVTGEPAPTATTENTAGDSSKVTQPAAAESTSTEPAPAAIASTIKSGEPAPASSTTTTTATTTTTKEATTPLSSTSVSHTLPQSALLTPTLTHTGATSTLSALLSASKSGIIVFTYPKASTPGCTTQACLFRDNYDDLRAKGYDVYGLSSDSEKANTGFKTKQNLQYDMLCDVDAKLTGVLGMKKPGAGKGTLRGVIVIGKEGEVKVWFQGGPAKTLDAVREFVG